MQAHAQLGLVNLGEARVLAGEFARLRPQRATARQRRAGPTPAFRVWRLSPSPVESLALGLRSNVNEAWLLARINHPWPLAPQRLQGCSPAFLQCIDWMLQPRPANPSQSAKRCAKRWTPAGRRRRPAHKWPGLPAAGRPAR